MGVKFKSLDEARRYANQVVSSDRGGNFKFVSLNMYEGSSGEGSCATLPNTIGLARYHWDQGSVLHELAHLATDGNHSPRFLTVFLSLVFAYMGQWYFIVYRDAFIREKILRR